MSLVNMYYTLCRRLKDIWREIRWFPRNVARLINYLPLIWRDRDWDHAHFFEMMRFKLKRMEKRMALGITGSGKRDAERIHICVLLIDRILADGYFENAEIRHNQKWGESVFDETPIEDPKFGRCYKMDITRPGASTAELEEQEQLEFRRVMDHAHYMAGQDMDYLFSIIRKHVGGWWD